MDAVELARRRAAALHDEAVAGGADPWVPRAIVAWVATRMEIDAEPIAPGSPLLAGGRAHFDPIDRAIRYEDRGTDFDKAFLVGHELGHASLGDDRVEHVARDVDPTRSSEAAPIGEDRVVDYSRRQRREVQMDLFGREIILPRARARRLHLEGMTATEIADRLGASFDAVAQQMLDALLLPVVAGEETPVATAPKPLNPEQRDAARHRGAPYLLEAGPGTGKTQTLVYRVASLVDDGVDPRAILVLTFSNKAAGELSDRISALRPEAASAMWVGTFHAFGLDLVRRFHRQLGFTREPRLMDRSEAIAVLEHEYLSLGLVHHQELWDPSRPLRDMLAAISRAKDEVADADRFAHLSRAMLDAASGPEEREAAERCAEVAVVYRRYEALKRAAEAVDFGDLVSLPVTLLEGSPEIAADLRRTYAHILVDEYQDVNRSSVRLLRQLSPDGRGLWAVGDARQSIYRFRGASSFNMTRFASGDFPGAAGGRLRVNYRSSPEIVSAFSAFGRGMAVGTSDAELVAVRSSGGASPEHVSFGDNDDEADALADEIAALAPQIGFRGQAVLCSGNDRLARIGRELERRGIPVLHLGNLFDRPEVKDLLALLSLLVDRRAVALVRRPVLPGFEAGLDLAGAAAVLDHLRGLDVAPMSWVQGGASLPSLSDADSAALANVGAMLNGFGPNDRPWPVLARVLLDRTRAAALVATADDVVGRARGVAIWQLLGFLRARRPGPGQPIQGTLDAIRRLVQLADERDLRQIPLAAQGIDAVRLMTIHASKGLEFPAVHLMGMNKNSVPSSPKRPACPVPDGMIEGGSGGSVALAAADHVLEQECLFYVAASRARDRLLLYSATRDAGGRTRNPSPFLARLGPVQRRAARPRLDRPADPEREPLPIRVGPPTVVSTAQLGLYTRCPRRFLYTHVLGTGGRRTPTTLSMMHDVVRAVVEEVARTAPRAQPAGHAEATFSAAWAASSLAGEEYRLHREIAALLVRRFAASRAGGTPIEPPPFRAVITGDIVTAKADDLIEAAGGRRVARVVRTGHANTTSGRDLADAAFQIAVASALPGCSVEVLHLSDEDPAVAIAFDARALGNRREKLAATLAGIGAGRFEPERSEWTCPTCPAFFICGPVADGALQKNL